MSTTPTKTKKEDPLHRLSRTPTNATRQQQWSVWKNAESHRHTPVKHDVLRSRSSPMKIPSSSPVRSPRPRMSPTRIARTTRPLKSPNKKAGVKLSKSIKASTTINDDDVPKTIVMTKVPSRRISALTIADDKTLSGMDKGKAMALFDGWDDNGSGRLSLAELDKGIIASFPKLNHKPAIMRAYKATDTSGDGFVSRSEFNFFWNYLVHYNNLWTIFGSVDQDGDRRITRDEWMASGMDRALFDQVDTNSGGMVLFDELCKYMTKQTVGKNKMEAVTDDEEDSNLDDELDVVLSVY